MIYSRKVYFVANMYGMNTDGERQTHALKIAIKVPQQQSQLSCHTQQNNASSGRTYKDFVSQAGIHDMDKSLHHSKYSGM